MFYAAIALPQPHSGAKSIITVEVVHINTISNNSHTYRYNVHNYSRLLGTTIQLQTFNKCHIVNICSSCHIVNICSSSHVVKICSSCHVVNSCSSSHVVNICSYTSKSNIMTWHKAGICRSDLPVQETGRWELPWSVVQWTQWSSGRSTEKESSDLDITYMTLTPLS